MSLKEKFQKAGLTEKKVKMPEAKITDENGDKQTYKISKKSQKLVDQYQGRRGKVVSTPGAMVKGASFANKQEKHKASATPILDAITKRAGNAIASGNAGIISGNAKNASVIANAIANSRKSAENVRTPIAATKGSVFVNKGYNPQNKSKSTEETKRLETAAQKANDFARKMQEKESALDTEGKEGLGKVGRAAYDLGKVGTQLAVDATAGLLVPGGGLASVGTRSFGQGVMQAEDEGKTGKRAILYGAGTAAIETGTEKLTAAAKPLKAIYGAGVVESVLGKLTKKLNSSAKGRSALATIAKAASGEAAEEALADVLQVPLQRAVLENGAKFDADWAADTAYDALLGGVMGGVLGGGSVAVDRMQNRSTNSAKTMADAMQRAREKNQKKSTGNAPPVMQGRLAQTTPTQRATAQNIPAQNINVNRQQSTAAPEIAADPANQLRAEYEALQSGGGSGTMNENGGVGYGGEGQVSNGESVADRSERTLQERGEIDRRGSNSWIQSNDNSVRVGEMGGFGRAGEYGIQVIPVSDEYLVQRGHQSGKGFSRDGVIYVSENIADEDIPEFIYHELVHTMKQNEFEPYLQFTQGVENYLNGSDTAKVVLGNMMLHRKYDGSFDDLDLDQQFTVLDELNATLYGGYKAYPEFFAQNIRSIMNDPESYISELSDIMEQYKARNDGLGAADRGSLNSLYENLQAQSTRFYPEGANAARPVDVPMYDANGNPISKSASTVLGAKAIPDEVIPQIEQMIADGKMSYTTIKDQESLQRARTTVERYGFDGAMQDFRKAVNSGQVSKDIMTLGQTLLNTAANNRDGHAVAEILTLYQSMNTNLGQAMQAASILRKLEPESQLYGIRRVVDNLNSTLEKRKKKSSAGKRKKNANAGETLSEDSLKTLREQYKTAKDLLADIARVMKRENHSRKDLESIIEKYPQYKDFAKYFSEIDEYISNEKQSGWVQTLGRELAGKADQRASDKSTRDRTVYETVLSDLTAFMNQYVDSRKVTKKPRTAAERIRDYFDNRNEYAGAWSIAQNQLRGKYRDDQLMLDRLDDFLNEAISYTGGNVDTVMMEAVADSAIAEGIKAKEFTVRKAYDKAALADQIAENLIRETGATGANALVIRNAAKRYIAEKRSKTTHDVSDAINRDIRATMRDFGIRLSKILTQDAKSKSEMAKRISDILVSNYHISKDGAEKISEDITAEFTDMVKEASRKKLDSIFKERPKREQKDAVKRFEELANLGAFFGEYNEKATEKVFGGSVQLDPALVQKFLDQKTQEGRDAVMQEIYQNVASQVPSTWKEKWDAWRYLAMLGNPRTHIRNIVGNAAFQPVRFMKNEIAAGMEAGLNKLGINIERTKSFSVSPALYRAAWNDYANAKDILGGSKYNEIETAIEKNRRILPGILEIARVKNSAFLEAEDAIAKRITYADSLAGYLKANGITAEQFMNGEADGGIVNKARNYAAQEALKATYQDKNAFSNRFVDIVSKTGIVGDAIIPFKRTPANILVRSIEYSPIGAVKAITYDLAKVKSGEKTAAQVIDAAAAGLTGTGLFALGAYLFADGLLTVAQGDDKEDKWAQLLGHQAYALELPDGTSVTIDWLAPDSLPFFMGAEMMSSVGENGWSIESIWDALKSVANPMLDLSMLQSVNDLIDSVKYAESSPLAAMVPSAIVSYFSQAFPTVLGQIERTAEDKRMMTYTEKDGKLPTDLQYAIGKVSAKIPGLDYQQVPYINEWGQEEQTGTPFQRAFNNFLNPSYTSQVDIDKVEKSIQSVYDATGEKSVFPDKAKRTLTINNEDKNLTASEYEKYAKKLGKERYTLLKEAVNSDAYGELSNAEKAEFISEIYSYSKAMTEHDLFGKEINKKWYTEAKESGNVLGAIRDHVLYTVNGNYSDKAKTAVEDVGITLDQYSAMRNGLDADGNGAVSQSEAKAYLDGQDFSRDQKSQLWKIINKSWKSNPYG